MVQPLIFQTYNSFLSYIKLKNIYELSGEIDKSRYHCVDYDIYVYDARFLKLDDILKDLEYIKIKPTESNYINYIALLNIHIYKNNIKQLCNFIENTNMWTKWFFTSPIKIELLDSYSIYKKSNVDLLSNYLNYDKYCKDEIDLGWEYPLEIEWTEGKIEAEYDKLYLVPILDTLTTHLLKRDLIKGRQIMEEWIKNNMKYELLINGWNDYLCKKYPDKWHDIIKIFANFSQNITSNDGTYSYLHFNFDGLFIYLNKLLF